MTSLLLPVIRCLTVGPLTWPSPLSQFAVFSCRPPRPELVCNDALPNDTRHMQLRDHKTRWFHRKKRIQDVGVIQDHRASQQCCTDLKRVSDPPLHPCHNMKDNPKYHELLRL